jgi:hypothetical protein
VQRRGGKPPGAQRLLHLGRAQPPQSHCAAERSGPVKQATREAISGFAAQPQGAGAACSAFGPSNSTLCQRAGVGKQNQRRSRLAISPIEHVGVASVIGLRHAGLPSARDICSAIPAGTPSGMPIRRASGLQRHSPDRARCGRPDATFINHRVAALCRRRKTFCNTPGCAAAASADYTCCQFRGALQGTSCVPGSGFFIATALTRMVFLHG